MIRKSSAFLMFLLLSVATSSAEEQTAAPVVNVPAQALQELRRLAVQHNGRVKPLDSFAWETLDRLTGAPRYRGQDPVATVLSIAAFPSEWQEAPLLSVPFVPLREALGIPEKTRHVSYSELLSTRKLMRMLPAIVEKQQRSEKLTMLENETMDLYDRFVLFTGLMKQELNMVPPPPARPEERRSMAWLPIVDSKEWGEDWSRLISALRENDPAAAIPLKRLSEGLPKTHGYPARWRLDLEVFYNQFAPFRVARFLYLLAAALFLLLAVRGSAGPAPDLIGGSPRAVVATALYGVALAVHAAGILTRVVLGSRPPVSNFYETMLWLPFVGAALAAVFEGIYRRGFFASAGGLLAAILLLLADHLPLDPSISPVVAVLRSNLWLTVHVLTIVGSYAPITLAAVLAHLYGSFYLARGARHPALDPLGTYIYRSIQVGVVLLAAGIMLGAVWANASWGRYWGWDPKETWALITLLWYLALLHGRFAGWIQGAGMAAGTIAGFFLLLMTYYGVSFYLVGLHSYAGGNAKPLPPLLLAYLLAEVGFVAAVALKAAGLHRQTV